MGEWFTHSFGEDYPVIYRHRNRKDAEQEVRAMTEWMELPSGARIIDVGCGMGRHAFALAELGFSVTGLDLSDDLLDEARSRDPDGRVTWLKGDMRRLPVPDGTFDAAVNWFTSFGYFEDEADNVNVLKEIRRVLKPDGRFLIDFLNPAHVKRHLVPVTERMDEHTGLQIIEHRSVGNGWVMKRIEVMSPHGDRRQYTERVRLYGLDDFRRMTGQAGLAIGGIRGGYDGASYRENESPRLILTGRPAA